MKRLICRLFGHRYESRYFRDGKRVKFPDWSRPGDYKQEACARCGHISDQWFISFEVGGDDVLLLRHPGNLNQVMLKKMLPELMKLVESESAELFILWDGTTINLYRGRRK